MGIQIVCLSILEGNKNFIHFVHALLDMLFLLVMHQDPCLPEKRTARGWGRIEQENSQNNYNTEGSDHAKHIY